jgi:hypothetical protein
MSASTTIPKSRAVFPSYGAKERRDKGRIQTPVLVVIRKVGAGHGADITSVVDNLSAGGFYVRLRQTVEPGERVCALIRFAAARGEKHGSSEARIAVRGRVLRVENLGAGAYGVAVRISRYKFI